MDNQIFSDNEKYAIVNMLTMIMEADTVIHPKEIEYMDSILKDFFITTADNEHMDNMDVNMCICIIKSMPIEKRNLAKEILSTMVIVDGYSDPRETKLLDSL